MRRANIEGWKSRQRDLTGISTVYKTRRLKRKRKKINLFTGVKATKHKQKGQPTVGQDEGSAGQQPNKNA